MLDHFVKAQNKVYERVQEELQAGRKRSHWMWFIFPQLVGLGSSINSARYGIHDIEHAKAYSDHSLLGERLRTCTSLVTAIEGRTARQIFGHLDNLKFRSCLTLFLVATEGELFRAALDKFYQGKLDPLTLRRLEEE